MSNNYKDSIVSKMAYNIDWIIPTLRKPSKLWQVASSFTVAAVGLFTKIIIEWFNKPVVYNRNIIIKALDDRPKNVPLITISNHHSCFDDPGIWGVLRWRHLFRRSVMRWSLAAHDICFTQPTHSYFFALGKCVPVVRGNGVYQEAIDFCIERLRRGQWVHIFPEGKVNMTKENMRLKWGVGRMIFESPVPPLVVPIWHMGMDDVLPNTPPYILRLQKRLLFNYGQPIDFTDIVQTLRQKQATDVEARKYITDYIQDVLLKLKMETELLHAMSSSSSSSSKSSSSSSS